jgi:hypothetical protein
VVENEITYLAFPQPGDAIVIFGDAIVIFGDAIVIFGGGYAVNVLEPLGC